MTYFTHQLRRLHAREDIELFQLFLLKSIFILHVQQVLLLRELTLVCRIFMVEKLSNNLIQESIPLSYTPRNFVRSPDHPLFYAIESDNNVLPLATRLQLQNDPSVVNGDAAAANLPPEDFGYPKGRNHWASCIQVIDPITDKKVIHTIDLENNEAAVSIAAVPFASQDGETFIVVGTGKDIVVSPRSHQGGFVHIYRTHDSGRTLEFIHKTKVDEPPMALLAFQGRLLAGIGVNLFLFDLGKKQLLRKSVAPVVPTLITGLQTQGSRIVVSDLSESVIYVVYKYQDNKLIPFVDDTISRWTTCSAMVDYETVAGGDKFGNLWLVRCPQKASEEADEEGSGAHLTHERQYLQGAPNKLSLMAHYFCQDIPMSIQKTGLVPGGRDVLLWGGLQGTLGILVPFVSRDDVDFFTSLESQMRSEDLPLAGRDHLIYRGYYVPVKGVIDGDLCERFTLLTSEKKAMIAGELDRTVREVERKVADMRARVAF